jgi:hypothetical protein
MSISAGGRGYWGCSACTFLNTNPLGLACEVCGSVRNTLAEANQLPSSMPGGTNGGGGARVQPVAYQACAADDARGGGSLQTDPTQPMDMPFNEDTYCLSQACHYVAACTFRCALHLAFEVIGSLYAGCLSYPNGRTRPVRHENAPWPLDAIPCDLRP